MDRSPVAKLCEMPRDFHSRDISMFHLFREVGRVEFSETEIESHLQAHPDLIEDLVGYSADQRCTPSWALLRGTASSEWRVCYVSHTEKRPEHRFSSGFAACAFFVA